MGTEHDDTAGGSRLAAGHMIDPEKRQFAEPGVDEQKALADRVAEMRDRYEAQRVAAEPFRRAALAMGPELRDLEAAVACLCGCHPSAPEMTLHDGGATCACQMTDDDRAAAWKALSDHLVELAGDEDERPSLHDVLDGCAAELGVELREVVPAAPFVISGLVDGRGFYLRERHGSWEVVIADDADPAADVWRAPRTEPSIVVARGVDDDFTVDGVFSPERALRIAVDAVRLHLARQTCAHAGAVSFCPTCGVAVAAATGAPALPAHGAEVLWLFGFPHGADAHASLFWRSADDGTLDLFAQCSDTFAIAAADVELIEGGDVPLLRACLDDLRVVDATYLLGELFASRKRRLRPMEAWLRDLTPAQRALFEDAATDR
jgi:hypothetical protein